MRLILNSSNTSSSLVYANVAYAIEDMVSKYFPKDFFKYRYTTTEIGYKTMRRYKNNSPKNEIMKKNKPFLIIQPQLIPPDNEHHLYNTLMTTNFDNIIGINSGNLFCVINDIENGYDLAYKINVDKLEFDCTIVLDTMNQAHDEYKRLMNEIRWDRTSYYRASLESMIPKITVYQISRLLGLDISDTRYIGTFLSQLKSKSGYPITYKIKNASQTGEFFVYYIHNILVTFTDLNPPSVSRKNYVEDFWEFHFKIEAEFKYPAVYYVIGNNDSSLSMQLSVNDIDTYCDNNNVSIPIYTLQNVFSMYPPSIDGKTYYANFIFQIEKDDSDPVLNLSEMFDESGEEYDILYILKQAALNSESYESYIMIDVYRNDKKLLINDDFDFDFIPLSVHIKNPDYESTYRLIIYLDMVIINDRKVNYYNNKKNDKSIIQNIT